MMALLSLALLMSRAEKEALWQFVKSIRARVPLAGDSR